MSLAFLNQLLNETFFTLNLLIDALQEHAGKEEYAVIKLRTKINKKTQQSDICYFVCDRERKIHTLKNQKRIHKAFRINDCLFSVIVKHKANVG